MSVLSNPEPQIQTNTTGDQISDNGAVVVALAGGGFVSVWASGFDQGAANPTDGNNFGIFAQLYDNDGNKIGVQFQVNGATATRNAAGTFSGQNYPSATALSDGGFVIAWSSNDQAPSSSVWAQRYDANGVRAPEGQIQVNAASITDVTGATVEGLPGGGFLVTWFGTTDTYNQTGPATTYDIYSRVFTAAGAAVTLGDTLVNTAATGGSGAGTQQINPASAGLSGGTAVIVYQSHGEDGSAWGVYSQVINTATGAPVGVRSLVNTTTTGNQYAPAIATLGDLNANGLVDDGYVVVWTAEGQEGGGNTGLGIYGQRFSNAHVKVGVEFRVNSITVGNQDVPSVVGLSDGTFVVSWTSRGADGTNSDVYARRFDTVGTTPSATNPEQLVNQNTAGDQYTGQDPSNNQLGIVFPNAPTDFIPVVPAYAAYTDYGGRNTLAQLSNGELVLTWSGAPDASGAAYQNTFVRIFGIGTPDPNDAPVLDATRSPTLDPVQEDALAPFGPVGTLVSSLVDLTPPSGDGIDNVTDVDTNAVTGLALTGVGAGGTWFYSTDDGDHWTLVGAVSDASALLLAADDVTRIYFRPTADSTSSSSITFRAWDQTQGGNGDRINTSPNGASTAFSSASDTASIAVTAVNDAPTLAVNDPVPLYTENGLAVTLTAAVSIGDTDSTMLSAATVRVNNFVVGDELRINGTTGGTVGAIDYSFSDNTLTLTGAGTLADYEAALELVTFVSTGENPTNFNTNTLRTIEWRVDNGTPLASPNDLFTRALPDTDVAFSGSGFADTPYSVHLSDFNNDGILDFVTANSQVSRNRFDLVVAYGEGDGTFGDLEIYDIGGSFNFVNPRPVQIVLGAFNADIFEDLAVTSSINNEVLVFTGSGTGLTPGPVPPFPPTAPAAYAVDGAPVAITAADFDEDGDVDLAVGLAGSFFSISLLEGSAAGTFTLVPEDFSAVSTRANLGEVSGIVATDINGDLHADLVATTNNGSVGEVKILFGDGTGNFAVNVPYAVGPRPSSLTVTDLNNDGRLDIVVTNGGDGTMVGDGTVSVLLQNADATFAAAVSYATGATADTNPNAVAVGDLDGDGVVDLAVANRGADEIALLLGNGDGTFDPAIAFAVGSGPNSLAIGNINGSPSLDIVTANFDTANAANPGFSVTALLNNTNSFSAVERTTVAVSATNDAPDVVAPATISASADNAVALTGITFSDPDGGALGQTETVTFALGTGSAGTFSAIDGDDDGVVVTGQASATLTLTGSIADLNAFIVSESVTYTPTAAGGITVTIEDGGNTGGILLPLSDVATIAIDINEPPVVAGAGGTAAYTEGAAAVVIDSSLTVTDVDDTTLSGATVEIGDFVSGDVLSIGGLSDGVTGPAGAIAFSFVGSTLTLSGAATKTDYEAALESVAFSSTSINPTNSGLNPSRTISFVVNDGGTNSVSDAGSQTTINVTAINSAPVLNGLTPTLTYTEGSVLFIAYDQDQSNLAFVSDEDTSPIAGGTITIGAGRLSGDRITANGSGISSSYDASTGVFTFTTTSASPDYDSFFDSLRFAVRTNPVTFSDDPSNGGANPTRTLTWVIDDGQPSNNLSTPQTQTISIAAVNDAPVVNVASEDAQIVAEEEDLSITGLSISDRDAGAGDLTVTLAVGQGALTVSTVMNGAAVTQNGTASVVLTGTVTEINTTLAAADAVVYRGADGYFGNDTLTVTANDNGNTGSDPLATGGADNEEGVGSIDLIVTAVNDAPVATVPTSIAVTEDVASALTGISFADDSGDTDVVVTLSVGSGTLAATSNAEVTVGGSTIALTLTGAVADINSFIAGSNVTFTTASNATADVTLTVAINDGGATGFGGAMTDSETVTLDVSAANDLPTAVDDALGAIAEDSGNRTIAFTVLTGNDSTGPADESGQTLTITAVSNVVGGTAQVVGTNVVFSPTAHYNGPASFDYTVQDNGSPTQSDTGAASFSITEVNDAPTAVDDSLAAVDEDSGTRTIAFADLTGNDSRGPSNESGQALTITAVSNPTGGAVQIVGGAIQFTPNANFTGTAGFDYTVQDDGTTAGSPDALTDLGRASFTVNDLADTPSVTGATTAEDTQSSGGLLLSRNAADGSGVTHFKITGITNGTLFLNDGVTPVLEGAFITFAQGNAGLRFTPSANVFGTGSFDAQASTSNSDAGLGGALVEATITISPVADAPAVAAVTTAEDTLSPAGGLVITPNAVDGSEVTHFRISGVTAGAALFLSDGTTPVGNGDFITAAQGAAGLRYDPADDVNGPASFNVQGATSAAGAGLGPATAASVTITEVNDAPVPTNDALSSIVEDSGPRTIAIADLLANDTDQGAANESGQTLTLDVDGSTTVGGTVMISGTDVIFTPTAGYNGPASFTYRVTDDGTTNSLADPQSGMATVSFSITALNTPPEIEGFGPNRTFLENDLGTAQLLDADEMVVFRDVPGDFDGGTLVVAGAEAEDVLSVLGGQGLSVTSGELFFDVDGDADLDLVGAVTGGSAGVDLTVTFTAAATVEAVGTTLQRLAIANADDTPTVTRDLTVTVTDAGGLSDDVTITVSITSQDGAPVPVDDTGNVLSFGSTSGDVLTNDSDEETPQADLTVTGGTFDGVYGTLTLESDGDYTYAADDAEEILAGDRETDVFTYTLSDGTGNTDTGALTITIVGRSDGGEGPDTIGGGTESGIDNTLNGNGGDDQLSGNAGSDTINGGAGNDTALLNLATGGSDRIDLGTGVDRIVLSGAGQVLLSLTAAEVGNGSPLDSDTLINQDGGLAVRLQAGGAGVTPSGPVTRADDEGISFSGAGVLFEVRDLTAQASRGTGFAEVTLGTAAGETLVAGPGRTYLNAGLGNDIVGGGAADDVIVGGAGDDRLFGNGGNDSFSGGAGRDLIEGGAGNDVVDGTGADGNGDDALIGGDGNDDLNGGSGNDYLTGDAGDDFLLGAAGNDELQGGAGNDVLSGAEGGDVLVGGSGDDRFFGGGGNDFLHGGEDGDLIEGGAGDDVLIGGSGSDYLVGNAGADVFAYEAANNGFDQIGDFETGVDRLNLFALRSSGADTVTIVAFDTYSLVLVDQDADGTIDFAVQINGAPGVITTSDIDFQF